MHIFLFLHVWCIPTKRKKVIRLSEIHQLVIMFNGIEISKERIKVKINKIYAKHTFKGKKMTKREESAKKIVCFQHPSSFSFLLSFLIGKLINGSHSFWLIQMKCVILPPLNNRDFFYLLVFLLFSFAIAHFFSFPFELSSLCFAFPYLCFFFLWIYLP